MSELISWVKEYGIESELKDKLANCDNLNVVIDWLISWGFDDNEAQQIVEFYLS